MIIIPAIDIKDGRCVRLKRGKMKSATIFSDEPILMAKKWFSQGAKCLHVIDLDGAKTGSPVNEKTILQISKIFFDKQIQVGGGIRQEESAGLYLKAGISKVIVGTKAVTHPELVKSLSYSYPGRIILAIDFYKGKIKTEGWLKDSHISPEVLLRNFLECPLSAIILTDISRDGMLEGPNIKKSLAIASESPFPVMISGGIANLDQIAEIIEVNTKNSNIDILGVICGRSLYEKNFTLEEAIKITEV